MSRRLLPRQPFLQFEEPGEELTGARLLPLALIDPNPQQSRQVFEITDLAASIAADGVMQPIVVRPLDGGRYQIIAGERRYRAAQQAGLDSIPALIREGLTEDAAIRLTITENLHRQDLDVEDEARLFQWLMTRAGLSGRALADQLHIGYNYVNRRLRLLDRPDLLAKIRSGELSLETAESVVREADRLTMQTQPVIRAVSPRLADSDTETTDSGLAERATQDRIAPPPSYHNAAPPPLIRYTHRAWDLLQRARDVVARLDPASIPPPERAERVAEIAALETELARLRAVLEANP